MGLYYKTPNMINKLVSAALSYATSLLLLMACNNNSRQNTFGINAEANQPDTAKPIITTKLTDTVFPQIFKAAFDQGTEVIQAGITYNFYEYPLGKINIESGKIIACDPIVMRDVSPFAETFSTGKFPVHLAMATTENDARVAFSKIIFSDSTVVTWEFALKSGQAQIPLADTSIYCYGVDAGTGIFIDSVANRYFNQLPWAEWEKVFVTRAEQNGYRGYLHEFDGHNLATFSTGYGDGCYATYIGRDIHGKVCQLLTDFGLVSWWKLKH